jgi:hypothetical protein
VPRERPSASAESTSTTPNLVVVPVGDGGQVLIVAVWLADARTAARRVAATARPAAPYYLALSRSEPAAHSAGYRSVLPSLVAGGLCAYRQISSRGLTLDRTGVKLSV